MSSLKISFTWMVLLVLMLSACAVRPPYEEANDPLEPVNRVVFKFNDLLDRSILRPTARGYEKTVPVTVRNGVRNFYSNLLEPITIINDVLQGKGHQAASDTMRFGFNTVFGVFGVIDVSTGWGLAHNKEDFGQTFAAWGAGEGWYLVLPLLGPSTGRDAAGLIPEWQLSPVQYIVEDEVVRYAAWGLFFVSQRADLLNATDVLEVSALDPYLQVREAYRQLRWSMIHDGDPPEPDFFDVELFD